MPVQPTYPGVYIEEIPSGVRTITGVSTSIAAFIGYFRRGPMNNEAVQVFNFGDFERAFGGLDINSEASYAIQQFFLNGGSQAYVIRVASGSFASANIDIGSSDPLSLEASEEGIWGDNIRIFIDQNTPENDEFNMTITEYDPMSGQPLRQEIFRNLGIDQNGVRRNFVWDVLNDENTGSKIVRVGGSRGTQIGLPPANGTVSGEFAGGTVNLTATHSMNVSIGTASTPIYLQNLTEGNNALLVVATALQTAIRNAYPNDPVFAEATVQAVGGNQLQITAGGTDPNVHLIFSGGISATLLLNEDNAIYVPPNSTQSLDTLTDPIALHAPNTHFINIETRRIIELSGLDDTDTLTDIAAALQTSIRSSYPNLPAFSGATVQLNGGGDQLVITNSGSDPNIFLSFSGGISPNLLLDAANSTYTPPRTTNSGVHGDPANVNIGTNRQVTISVIRTIGVQGLSNGANDLSAVALSLENAIRSAEPANPIYASASVDVIGNRLRILAGGNNPMTTLSFSGGISNELQLAGTAVAVVQQQYLLGGGDDGLPPDATALIGSLNSKTGMFALEDVDLFNILCIPRTGNMDNTAASAVLGAAIAYCNAKRAFLIIDTPTGIDELPEIKNWMDSTGNNLRDKNAALYYPRVRIPDPLDNFRLRSVGASGTIAGLYARTDGTRGVWKAPAGTEANLRNVSELTDILSDRENGVLNPLGINCLVNKPVFGNISWGARTLVGADQMASEWKYVPVRRLTLFLEESLYRGLQWAVFEPNDESLWGQIRLNVGAFMNNLFKQGAFQGSSPREAYLVKCDRETTTQNDINLGIVNVVVGFAPLKPAEFVIIKIQQLAGQVQS